MKFAIWSVMSMDCTLRYVQREGLHGEPIRQMLYQMLQLTLQLGPEVKVEN